MNLKRSLAVLSAAALVAFPAGAMAKNASDGGHGKGGKSAEVKKPKKPKKPKVSTYEFRGLVAAVGDGTVSVDVKSGNSRGKKFKGQTLTFEVTKAKLKVADVNKDGKRDLADVAVGDRVAVQAKLPRGAVDATATLPARHVLDKGPVPPPEPEDEAKPEEPKPETPEAPAG